MNQCHFYKYFHYTLTQNCGFSVNSTNIQNVNSDMTTSNKESNLKKSLDLNIKA